MLYCYFTYCPYCRRLPDARLLIDRRGFLLFESCFFLAPFLPVHLPVRADTWERWVF